MKRETFLRKIFLAALLALWAIPGTAQTITQAKQQIAVWQSIPELSNASIGIAVTDNQTGEELIKSAPQLSLIPASILKLVTTATALEVFGPDFRFQTVLSYSGTIRNDTLFGDLQIIGGGDPTLGSEYFPESNRFQEQWITAMQSKNIRVITGNLVLDAGIYESQTIPDKWIWEDIGNYYGAGASGISVCDNQYQIHLSTGQEAGMPATVVRVDPEVPGLVLQNEVLTSDQNSDQSCVYGSPLENKRIIRGTIPKNKTDFIVKASVPDPSALLAGEFRKKLTASGISISGKTEYTKAMPETGQLSVILSPPLRDIIRVTNHESVNLFAEHFLKHLAFQASGLGTTKGGCKFVVQFWKEKGLDMTGFFMNDGSGLALSNAITASHLVGILNYMKTKSAYFADFYQSMATVGNGTLTVFKSENFPEQCLRAKSGSMTRVRCYAGYLTTDSGRQLSYSIMFNNFSCSQPEAIRKIEKLLIELRKL
jgi:D-alanyl-D-alanine carboxypeptidase/D-alanyl-D-alanine-endopeptidase (penicillin-binding protein 4)